MIYNIGLQFGNVAIFILYADYNELLKIVLNCATGRDDPFGCATGQGLMFHWSCA